MHLLSFGWDVAFRIDEDVIFSPVGMRLTSSMQPISISRSPLRG